MSFQAYLDSIKTKTGKTTADFKVLADKKGLTQYRDVMTWLKTEYGLGHGHANLMAQLVVNADKLKAKPDEKIDKMFAGKKADWRKPYDALLAKLTKFGPDVKVAPTNTYISLLRGDKKFGIVQASSAERMDIGIKLKGLKPTERLEAARSWNIMVTHRVRITDPKQIDKEVLAWLKQAYEAID
jgi:hypothetical protein